MSDTTMGEPRGISYKDMVTQMIAYEQEAISLRADLERVNHAASLAQAQSPNVLTEAIGRAIWGQEDSQQAVWGGLSS